LVAVVSSARSHPIHALLYDPLMSIADRAGFAERRRRLVADARGEVVEVGGGTGRNLPFYRDVERVVVLEPDASMRARLVQKVAAAAVPVEVHDAALEESGLPDGFADTVVTSLVLCTVESPAAAIGEIRRLLKPDGRLLFLEHVRLPGLSGRLQSAATPLWARTAGAGCRLDRNILDDIRAAGFAVTDCHRSGVFVQGIAVPSKRVVPFPGRAS
jgi:SAM-dependent methyltransferase